MTDARKYAFGILLFITVVVAGVAYAQSPLDELNQLTAQLQGNPNNTALREEIIKLALAMKPVPTIPEEANRAFVKGAVFQKEAKNSTGYELAIKAYREALAIAPWWGDAYYNLAVALDSSGKPDEAITSLKLYLLTQPSDNDAREAQNRIYSIEAKKELQAREKSDTQKAKVAVAQSLVGRWYSGNEHGVTRLPNGNPMYTYQAEDIGGGLIRIRIKRTLNYYDGRGEVEEPLDSVAHFPIYTVTLDGNKITGTASVGAPRGFTCPAFEVNTTGTVEEGKGGRLMTLSYILTYKMVGGGGCERSNEVVRNYFYRQY